MKPRSKAFVPQVIAHLLVNPSFHCKWTDLPVSYRAQPYNLSAKLLQRGGIEAKITFSVEHNTFSIIKFGINLPTKTNAKRNSKNHTNSIPR